MPHDQVRATPQNPTLGAIAAALRSAQNFAERPFGYENPPVAALSELVGLPALQRTVERLSYGEPLTTGAGGIGGTTRPRDDAVDAAFALQPLTPLASVASKAANRGAMALGRAGERAAERVVPRVMERGGTGAELLAALTQGTTSNVVKPKGGNWLAGSVENAVQRLKTPYPDIVAPGIGETEEVIRARHPPITAINKWLDTKLTKYIRNEMGTPEDPVRALAERGVLHTSIPGPGPAATIELRRMRETAGYPSEGLASTPLGRKWEAISDYAIWPRNAQDVARTELAAGREVPGWLRDAEPGTTVNAITPETNRLELHHLVDELKFSMDPNSGLPQHLRFDVKDIDKITVPQAVERVSQINAWRAQEAAKAEKAGMLENLQATPRMPDEGLQLSFVDKPGGAWVDIPETIDDKGMKFCTSIGKAGGWCTQHEWAATSYGSGENRLTALVDAEGRPHAQAKITSESPEASKARFLSEMPAEQYQAFLEDPNAFNNAHKEWRDSQQPKLDITELKPVGNDFGSKRAQEYIRRDPQYKEKVTESVLKFLNSGEWGKVNAGDLDHYDIVDLQDTRSLVRAMEKAYHKPMREIAPTFNEMVADDPTMPRFMTTRQLKGFMGPIEGLGNNYAGGGLVSLHAKYAQGGFVDGGLTDQDGVDRMVDAQNAAEGGRVGYAAGGLVNYDPNEIDTIVSRLKEEIYA